MNCFNEIGIIKNKALFDEKNLSYFQNEIESFKESGEWTKDDLLNLFFQLIPDFAHKETGKYLNQKM